MLFLPVTHPNSIVVRAIQGGLQMRVSKKFYTRSSDASMKTCEVSYSRSWSNMPGEPNPIRLGLHDDEGKFFIIRLDVEDAVAIRTFLDNALKSIKAANDIGMVFGAND